MTAEERSTLLKRAITTYGTRAQPTWPSKRWLS